jgi:hypothetical protein
MFAITTAPNATVADWHGRIVVANIYIRDDINTACERLESILEDFDYQKAAEPPFQAPEWAVAFPDPDGQAAMSQFLDVVHPLDGRLSKPGTSFEEFAAVYRSLDLESEMIQFCINYIAACQERTPGYGESYPGYEEEAALLKEMTYCRNDGVKFKAMASYGRFAPVSDVLFFSERAENRSVSCRNPNVLLCSALSGIGSMAERFPGVSDKQSAQDYQAILAAIPTLVEVLDEEGRNNSACKRARDSLSLIIKKTGSLEAFEGYLHSFNAPQCDSEWMIDLTERFHAESIRGIPVSTYIILSTESLQDEGTEPREPIGPSRSPQSYEEWQLWFQENRESLYYDSEQGGFIIDLEAASAYREKLNLFKAIVDAGSSLQGYTDMKGRTTINGGVDIKIDD